MSPYQTASRQWQQLYGISAICASLVLIFIPVQLLIYFISPLPETVVDWFRLFYEHPLLGLFSMDLLLMVDYLLIAIIFLSLSVSLWKINPSLVALALIMQLLSTCIYFSSATAFEMLQLARSYYGAALPQRALLLAAGESMLATWQGTAFNFSYVLGAVALLLISSVMVRSTIFEKRVAYIPCVKKRP